MEPERPLCDRILPEMPARSRRRVLSFNSDAERQSMTAIIRLLTAAGP
jgi:hypothetical protein